MAEPHDLVGILPDGMQKLLDLSERVFICRLSKEGSILACSDSLRRILGTPGTPVGKKLEEVFLLPVSGEVRLSMSDLTGAANASPLLIRLAMSNRPCRLIAFNEESCVTCWGEVIGDRTTSGLNEMSALAGNIQSLLTKIKRQNDELQHGLKAAAWLQNRFLPENSNFANIDAAWLFRPCESISGDYFNIFTRKDGRLVAYVLDVSGHGVASAMMGIAATQSLRHIIETLDSEKNSGSTMPVLLTRLENEFPIERFDLYFSIVYLEIDTEHRHMNWVNAGHPDPVLMRKNEKPIFLRGGGPFIGLDQSELVDEQQIDLQPGDRIFLYSDGITERRNPAGELFGEKLLLATLNQENSKPLKQTLDKIIADNDAFGAHLAAQDDLTLVGLEIPETPR